MRGQRWHRYNFIYQIFMKHQDLIFKCEGNLESEAFVYTFSQYLILENGKNVVQGILTTYESLICELNYKGHINFHGYGSDDMVRLKSIEPEAKKEILDAMRDAGINLLDSNIFYHSNFYIPSWYLYTNHGDLEEVMTSDLESEFHWSLSRAF